MRFWSATKASTLARYNKNGSLDTTFGTNGLVGGGGASAVAIQSDGKIVTVGASNNGANEDFALVRYLGELMSVKSRKRIRFF
jgi:uncharacterized membrane protein